MTIPGSFLAIPDYNPVRPADTRDHSSPPVRLADKRCPMLSPLSSTNFNNHIGQSVYQPPWLQ